MKLMALNRFLMPLKGKNQEILLTRSLTLLKTAF